MKERESFASSLGFLLISAGCAVGLGNVWRFPYITGQYGGAIFVLFYLLFLVIIGLPILVMEFSVGRASRKSAATSFHVLEPKGTKWHIHSYFAMIGNYVIMMFYTTVAGWMLTYFCYTARGDFQGASLQQVEQTFSNLTANPTILAIGVLVVCILGFSCCALGVQKGIERITKYMMASLFVIIIALAIHSVNLPNASEGLKFYLLPDVNRASEIGWLNVISAAMGQAFFTLSIGIGSMAIFGSYLDKKKSLTGESIKIICLDTFVAIFSGIIIFSSCSAFGVPADSGPKLVFITLPNVFNKMMGGRIWGSLFFIFMSFAALSTVIAVFENIVAFGMDLFNLSRRKSVIINFFAILILSMPCVFGFNLLSFITPLGAGTNILDLEDFIVSNNLLPLGSLIYLLFCVSKNGWGYENFLKEANEGTGIKFPKNIRFYLAYILPIIILFIFVNGYISFFA